MGDDHLDAQTSARLIKRAVVIKGSRERLAESLGVHPHDLAQWAAGKSFPPQTIFEKILEIILDTSELRPESAARPAPEPSCRPRVLVADNAEGFAAVAAILGGHFDLVPVQTLTDGLDLAQSSVVSKGRGIAAIICSQHFEGSQMLRFLECVKAYKPTSRIPFICYRAKLTALSDSALAGMREACEALGAMAYIDLAEREQRAGAERAAVEFRDALRAVVHFPPKTVGLRVLVVDDNADASHVLAVLIGMSGHEVHKADSGAAALETARKIQPAVAILDLGMPGVSGYELARAIRAEPWGKPVILIALTGSAEEDARTRAAEAGFDYYFVKPVGVESLLEVFPTPSSDTQGS